VADSERKLLLDDAFFCFGVLIITCGASEKVLMVPVSTKHEIQQLGGSNRLGHQQHRQSHFQDGCVRYATRYRRRMNQP